MSEDGTTGAPVGLRAPTGVGGTHGGGDTPLVTDYRLLTADY